MKAKNLIPYIIYLIGLVALLVTVQEPKQTLKASPSRSSRMPSAERSTVAMPSPLEDRAN
jgi:hypothetical protein